MKTSNNQNNSSILAHCLRSPCTNVWTDAIVPPAEGTIGPNLIAEVIHDVRAYLREAEKRYTPTHDEFFLALALNQAIIALSRGNYGIGAVAVKGNADCIEVYTGRNAIVVGDQDIARSVGLSENPALAKTLMQTWGHAEGMSLLRAGTVNRPDHVIPRTSATDRFAVETLSVFGTLEPCPMCFCTMCNTPGMKYSISGARDPGGAHAVSNPEAIPPVWGFIRDAKGLTCSVLSPERDPELSRLCDIAFSGTREAIDAALGGRS